AAEPNAGWHRHTHLLVVCLSSLGLVATSNTARAASRMTEFDVPNPSGICPQDITLGPDANLWFTCGGKIGRITPTGDFTFFQDVTGSAAVDIAAGPDGNLWFTARSDPTGHIGRITPAGVITTFDIPSKNVDPVGITPGPDRNLWFVAPLGAWHIARITPQGAITAFNAPNEE